MKFTSRPMNIIDILIKEQKEGKPLPLLPEFNAADAKHVNIPTFRPKEKK